ncbi:helix-turn-helix transcriptional regulator [Oenococcus sp. UCMA 16435]|nr:helix-turn-helix transcriptional regulator [Oenococcus sp. UCMA 16435]MDI4584625.1 helix-turn-helix domain-containing protein [Oenococcus sp. UCMA 14587]
MTLGSSLQEARKQKNFTQANIAKKLYVTRQTVSRWEQNKVLPNIYVLYKLSRLYELSLDRLVSESEKNVSGGNPMKNKKNSFKIFKLILFDLFLFS